MQRTIKEMDKLDDVNVDTWKFGPHALSSEDNDSVDFNPYQQKRILSRLSADNVDTFFVKLEALSRQV